MILSGAGVVCRSMRSVFANGVRRTRGVRVLCALMLSAAVMAAPASAQITADVIRGRVTGPDSQPVANVQVTAVSFNGGITKSKRTDKNGRYTITYANGEGDYWLSFSAIGYQPQRFEVKRNADEEVLIADIKLGTAQSLGTVSVTASGPRQSAARDTYGSSDVSGGDRYLGSSGLPPDQIGNLAAMAANSPGVQLIPGVDGNPDRFSMLGLDPSQNNSTLNGQQNGSSNVPRDAQVNTQLRAGYDVANRGFSAGNINTTTIPGSNYISRSGSGVFNAPQAQWNDRVGQSSQYSFVSLGGRASGPILVDKDFYSVSFQFDRRSQDLTTLLSTTPVVFQSAGISTDSVARLRTILSGIGVPVSTNSIGNNSTRLNASTLGGFDWAPKSPTSGHAFNLSYSGSYNSAGPQASASMTTPASLGDSKSKSGNLQLRHTNFFGAGILTETLLSLGGSSNSSNPFVDLPSGSVLVSSTLNDGTTTARSLSFGGSTNANASSRESASARNMLSWFSSNNKHRIKLITEVDVDRSNSDINQNLLGRFTYQSLSDLEAGKPSSFVRSLNSIDRSASGVIGSVALGDAWRKNPDVQIQYGVILDVNKFLSTPDANPAVQQAFGVANTHVPNGIYLSPRVGFSWLYGTSPQIPYADGFVSGPRATIRGGIGMFQNTRTADLLSGALSNTGLPGSAQQLSCTGAATPYVNWNSLGDGSSIPTVCADGSAGTVFANGLPSVTLFGKHYSQEKSIRTNLNWSGAVIDNRFTLNVNGLYSYNMHQPDGLDLNFRPNQQFALSGEASRPVYVLRTSIDPTSGLIAPGDARNSPLFNSVTELQSNLHSQSRQITASISPLSYITPKFRWSLSYSYLNVSQQYRGFTSASGNPLDVHTGVASQPQHDFGYMMSYILKSAVTLTLNGRLTSGSRFTPTVGGDINGDGRSNDRAFIFDPAQSAGTAFGTSLQSLLDHGSRSARDCLRSQLGTIADHNSCVGPWTLGNSTLRIAFNPSRIRLPQRTTLSFTVSNPVGGADLLLHGSDHLHGWGQTPFIDQSLYFVRGFDAANSKYTYEVNQRFGSTRATQTTSRTPVVATMQLSVNFAPTNDWQQLSQQLDRGRSRIGVKMTEAQVRQMSGQFFGNPMARLLQSGEQIHLTRVQADSLATMSRHFTRLVDSLWTPTAKMYAAMPKDYDRSDAQLRLVKARETAVDYLILVVPGIKHMLTKGQLHVLSSGIANMLEPRYLELMRSGQSNGEFSYYF